MQKDWQEYRSAKHIFNRIKVHANNGDFQSVAQELSNFASGKFHQNTNPMNPNPQAIENIYNGLSNTVQIVKPKIDKILNVSKSTKGPLEFINNYANYDRPEARQFMNLALNLPHQYYRNNEYTMISHQFNQQFNNFLAKFKPELQFDNNTTGIVFYKDSSISRELSNSSQLQKEVRSVFTKYPNNVILSDSEFALNEDTNLHYAIGHYTIINPKINNNGKFSAYLFDIYDFKYQSINELDDSIKLYILNNTAYLLQKLGNIRNYYVLIPIEFEW